MVHGIYSRSRLGLEAINQGMVTYELTNLKIDHVTWFQRLINRVSFHGALCALSILVYYHIKLFDDWQSYLLHDSTWYPDQNHSQLSPFILMYKYQVSDCVCVDMCTVMMNLWCIWYGSNEGISLFPHTKPRTRIQCMYMNTKYSSMALHQRARSLTLWIWRQQYLPHT